MENNHDEIIVNEKIDVWMLGLTLAWVYGVEVPSRKIINELDNPTEHDVLKAISTHPFSEPETENSIQHLVWSMLKVDPKQRVSMQEARERFQNIPVSKPKSAPVNMTSKYVTSTNFEE